MGDTGSLGLGGAIAGLAVMTQTEILLIIIGGIFVIEALSVAIQVFTFKTFRRRVLLMAPVHHHFEMMAWSETKIMLRFWIIAAVCSRDRLHALPEVNRLLTRPGAPGSRKSRPMRPQPAVRPVMTPSWGFPARRGSVQAGGEAIGMPVPTERPPLPDGPFLVVGLARSGIAAAEALVARGERVYGTDSGNPPDASRLADIGVELSLDGDGTELLDRVNAVIKSPGVPREAAGRSSAAREAGKTVIGELELGWRMLPNRFVAVTGTNGKTTVVEMARPRLA